MDSTSFRYLLSLAVQMALETRLLDVVTTYLYGDLDAQLHIKPTPDFLPNTTPAKHGRFNKRSKISGVARLPKLADVILSKVPTSF
jgi:hypothetical protein